MKIDIEFYADLFENRRGSMVTMNHPPDIVREILRKVQSDIDTAISERELIISKNEEKIKSMEEDLVTLKAFRECLSLQAGIKK